MQTRDPNQTFTEMRKAALEHLQGRSMEKVALQSGAFWGQDGLEIESLGKRYTLSLPDYVCQPEMDNWLYLVLLHYLDFADGTPVSEQPCTFGELKDGLVRGTKFDRTAEEALTRMLTEREPEQIARVCQALGGREVSTNADYSVTFPVFPRLPLVLRVWFADEEFPASGRLLLSRSADRYITVEDAVGVGEYLLGMLQRAFDSDEAGRRK